VPVVYNARGACGPNGSIMKCATLDFLGLVVTTVLFEIEKPGGGGGLEKGSQ
jgi:hypothetical protein